MTTNLLFDQRETSALVENFQQRNYHQYSCAIIRKVLEAKSFSTHEPLIVHALMEVTGNVLDRYQLVEADEEAILQLSAGLYDLLLRVECVEVG